MEVGLKADIAGFNSKKVNVHFVFEIKSQPFYFDNGFTLKKSLYGDVKLTKNPYPGKYSYSGYGISFDIGGSFSLLNGCFGKNVIGGANMSSCMHIDNKRISYFLVKI